jgi:hypothetical protein
MRNQNRFERHEDGTLFTSLERQYLIKTVIEDDTNEGGAGISMSIFY